MKSAGKIPSKKHQLYVPKKLCKIINKAVDVDPAKRFQSALEMRRSLEKLNYAGYWTSDPQNPSELIGVGIKYLYSYEEQSINSNLYKFTAIKKNLKGKLTRISFFCKTNLTKKEKEKIKTSYFEWVINNAQ